MGSDWRDQAREKVKEKLQGSTFKLAEGDNCFRLLPNAKGLTQRPYIDYLIHPNVGPDEKIVRCGHSINNPSKGECWLCDEIIPKLMESGNKKSELRASTIKPKEQMFCQVAMLDADSGKWRGPLKWYVSTGGARSMSVALLSTLSNNRRHYDDPKKGYNFNVTRTGTKWNNTRYGPILPDDAPSKVPSRILNALEPFSKVVPPYDEEVQRAAYYGRELDRRDRRSAIADREEDDETMIKKKKKDEDEDSAKKKKKKGKKVEEEEEEEEESDDDEEEEDEPVKKKKKKVVEEEEEEDEDEESDDDEEEDDEEEEDEPVKKKKGKKEVSKKKKKKEEDEEDEEEDDEEESDDDEEESDDDEEEDDEEEEDEPVKKKKKGAVAKKKVVKKKKKKSRDDDDD